MRDALSRMDETPQLNTLVATNVMDLSQISREIHSDPKYAAILKKIQQDPILHPPSSIQRGHLLYKGKLVISNTSSLIPQLLHVFHDSAIGGHTGILKTYKRLNRELFWVGMKADVKRYVEKCHVCQSSKTKALSPAGLLQSYSHCPSQIKYGKICQWIL